MLGQTPNPLKAGDLAPNLTWTRILQSPASGGPPGSLFGHVTVVGFFPAVSQNESLVSQWNRVAGHFADGSVQFVWIASGEAPPNNWLASHPVSGWLLLDPLGATGHSFGVDFGGAIIDTEGRVAGFTFMLPDEAQIQAVRDGHGIAMKGDATDAQMQAILSGHAVRLEAEPHRPPEPPSRPDIAPSYEVHISPSKTEGTNENQGPEWWILGGFEFKEMLAKVYGKDSSRMILPASLEKGQRYDIAFVPPREMDQPEMQSLMQQALEQHFHFSATVERRPADVYVMTAIKGKTPPAKPDTGGGSIGWSSSEFAITKTPDGSPPTPEMIREILSQSKFAAISAISASNVDIEEFCRILSDGLGRPVLDETSLKGSYDLEVHGNARSSEELLRMLRDQLGLVVTPESRNLDMLVIRLLQ